MVPISGMPTREIPKQTDVTLKRNKEMVPISGMQMACDIRLCTPLKACFICRDEAKEPILWVGYIALATPYTLTWTPTSPGAGKVEVEEAVHRGAENATCCAFAAPFPKWMETV
jgi:hypothetical protein